MPSTSRRPSWMSRINSASAASATTSPKANCASTAAHLLLDLCLDLFDGLAARGQDHVLQHLHVAGHFGVDFDFQQVFLAVHAYRDHAAAGGGGDFDLCDLLLHLLLHLLRLAHHLLHIAG